MGLWAPAIFLTQYSTPYKYTIRLRIVPITLIWCSEAEVKKSTFTLVPTATFAAANNDMPPSLNFKQRPSMIDDWFLSSNEMRTGA